MELRPRATTPFNTRERHNIVELRESGFSIRHVKRVTGASRSSQGAFLRAHRQGQSLEPAIPNRKGIRNPMAKITPEWENKLIELLDTPGTLTNAELNQKLEAATGISVDESTIVRHRQKRRSTRKRTTRVEVLDNPDKTRAAQKDFRILLDPSTGTVPFQFCTSTDEAGFNSNEVPTYGYSRVWQTRRVNPARTLSGGSYRDNKSRVPVKKAKTRAFRKHLCLTIGLNESRPVQHFKIIDKFYGGKEFLAYVQERTVTEEFKYAVGQLGPPPRIQEVEGSRPALHRGSLRGQGHRYCVGPAWVSSIHPGRAGPQLCARGNQARRHQVREEWTVEKRGDAPRAHEGSQEDHVRASEGLVPSQLSPNLPEEDLSGGAGLRNRIGFRPVSVL